LINHQDPAAAKPRRREPQLVSQNRKRRTARRPSRRHAGEANGACRNGTLLAFVAEVFPTEGASMTRRLLTALATLALTFPAAAVSAQNVRAYRVEAISGHSTSGFGINKDGDIAGCEFMPDGTLHAFRWTTAAGFEDLGANGSTWHARTLSTMRATSSASTRTERLPRPSVHRPQGCGDAEPASHLP